MHRLLPVVLVLILASTGLPARAMATAEDCAFAESFASRSGALPFAGSLHTVQIEAFMQSPIRPIAIRETRLGKHRAYRITTRQEDRMLETYILNANAHSYQINFAATKNEYRKQKKNLMKLLRDPTGPQTTLCR